MQPLSNTLGLSMESLAISIYLEIAAEIIQVFYLIKRRFAIVQNEEK